MLIHLYAVAKNLKQKKIKSNKQIVISLMHTVYKCFILGESRNNDIQKV